MTGRHWVPAAPWRLPDGTRAPWSHLHRVQRKCPVVRIGLSEHLPGGIICWLARPGAGILRAGPTVRPRASHCRCEMRIVFAGTPEFSVVTLRALLDAEHDVALVITQPDRRAGRGRKLKASPAKAAAVERQVPVFQLPEVNAAECVALARHLEPDVMVVQAFGQKLSSEMLSVPEFGCCNVHASLLPAYRGAAPVNWALINGEERTGVTIIRMNERIDAGEILSQQVVEVAPDWTAGELARVLSEVGARLMLHVLHQLEAGTARALEQDPSKVSRAPRLTKRDGLIPWQKPAREVHNHIRGMTPWPGAFTFPTEGRMGRTLRLSVLKSSVARETGTEGEPGTVLSIDETGLLVACGVGSLRIVEVKPAGGRGMSAEAFARGHVVETGTRFTDHE